MTASKQASSIGDFVRYLMTRPWPSGNMPTLNPMSLAAQILEEQEKSYVPLEWP